MRKSTNRLVKSHRCANLQDTQKLLRIILQTLFYKKVNKDTKIMQNSASCIGNYLTLEGFSPILHCLGLHPYIIWKALRNVERELKPDMEAITS